ncbi:MAG TPA: hypothetical protein VGG61_11070, partial [Gemmataceae bacterium]
PQFASLRDALERCDLAKFARVSPTAEECHELVRNAQALVVQTTRAEASSKGSMGNRRVAGHD